MDLAAPRHMGSSQISKYKLPFRARSVKRTGSGFFTLRAPFSHTPRTVGLFPDPPPTGSQDGARGTQGLVPRVFPGPSSSPTGPSLREIQCWRRGNRLTLTLKGPKAHTELGLAQGQASSRIFQHLSVSKQETVGDVGWAVGQRLGQPSGCSVVGADTDLGRRQEAHGHTPWRRAGHLRGET